MRKSRTPGSARGVGGNSRSYRDQPRWKHPIIVLPMATDSLRNEHSVKSPAFAPSENGRFRASSRRRGPANCQKWQRRPELVGSPTP